MCLGHMFVSCKLFIIFYSLMFSRGCLEDSHYRKHLTVLQHCLIILNAPHCPGWAPAPSTSWFILPLGTLTHPIRLQEEHPPPLLVTKFKYLPRYHVAHDFDLCSRHHPVTVYPLHLSSVILWLSLVRVT